MAFEQRDMSGALWRNTRRDKPSQPNATGTAMIDGVEYRVSAWTKDGKDGDKWQSLSFTRKDEEARPKGKAVDRDEFGDIPF